MGEVVLARGGEEPAGSKLGWHIISLEQHMNAVASQCSLTRNREIQRQTEVCPM